MTQQPHDHEDDAERRHLHAVDTPPDGVPTTVTPRPDQAPGDEAPEASPGLRAGDALGDVDALSAPPVDGHLIPLPAPTLAQRWKATADGERAPLVPGWLTDAQIAREAATRTVRQVGYVTAYRALRAPWALRAT